MFYDIVYDITVVVATYHSYIVCNHLIHFVEVLSDCLQQFSMYNVFKDDSQGLDLVQDGGPNIGVLLHKFLPRCAFILRMIYGYLMR